MEAGTNFHFVKLNQIHLNQIKHKDIVIANCRSHISCTMLEKIKKTMASSQKLRNMRSNGRKITCNAAGL